MNNIIKAAVIGDPISHSLSPKLHGYWLKKYNINGSYEAIQVKSENLKNDVESLIQQGFAGFNVTIPHKENIFKLCHQKSRNALLTKAVNTVVIQNGQIFGDNSDSLGFINNLKKTYPDVSFKNKNAFLIGAGGASRAIAYGLINEEVKNIFITNRNQEKAENLIKDFQDFAREKSVNLTFLNHQDFEQQLKNCDLLINSTSLGMHGQPELNLNIAQLKPSAIVNDIVYKPLHTILLQNALSQNNAIVTGVGMLAFQAAVGFEYWFKQKVEVDDALLDYLLKL